MAATKYDLNSAKPNSKFSQIQPNPKSYRNIHNFYNSSGNVTIKLIKFPYVPTTNDIFAVLSDEKKAFVTQPQIFEEKIDLSIKFSVYKKL